MYGFLSCLYTELQLISASCKTYRDDLAESLEFLALNNAVCQDTMCLLCR